MIDWLGVCLTAIWVLGLAILLAGWSYSRWSQQPAPRRTVWLGLALATLGLLAVRLYH